MRDIIKETFDVRLDNMIDGLRHDRFVHGVERLMATSLRSKTIGTIPKVHLVDRFQYPGDPSLHDFVFQCRKAEGSLLVVVLRYIHTFGRLRLVPLGLHAFDQVFKVLIQWLTIFLPTYTINATGSVPAEFKVASPEKTNVKYMS